MRVSAWSGCKGKEARGGRFIPAKTTMAFFKKSHMGGGDLCSLFVNALVTSDLTGGACGLRNAVRGCAPDFPAGGEKKTLEGCKSVRVCLKFREIKEHCNSSNTQTNQSH